MDRRAFLRSTALAVGVTALGPSFWQRAYASTAQPGLGPYGALGSPDAHGVRLPEGFRSRVLAVTGSPVPGTSYTWHVQPDGGAVFPQDDGGWVYTSNSEGREEGVGGVGALRFDARGEVVDAYSVLDGTTMNCAGGPSPWGTWLSCEEIPTGLVHECDVTGGRPAVPLPALGRFAHEAVTFDDARGQLYLTEDRPDGRFYRFTPDAYPDLSSGRLEAMATDADGGVSWVPVRSPELPQEQAGRPPGSRAFRGGEGVWFDSDHVYFTTKGDNRVWDLDVRAQRLAVLYDAGALGDDAPLRGVDNLVVSQSADIFVAEDGGDLEIVMITPDQVVAPVLRVVGHDDSEICGPAFSPDGSRLYFSSQRGTDGERGVTFEVTGPFRTARTAAPARGTLVAPPAEPAPAPTASPDEDGGSFTATDPPDDGGVGGAETGAAAAALAAGAAGAAGAAYAVRRRRAGTGASTAGDEGVPSGPPNR